MSKAVGFLKKNAYFFLLFAAMTVNCLLHYNWGFGLNDYRCSFYLGDFSIGFCSRLFIGTLLKPFKDTFTREWLVGFSWAVLLFAILLTALLLNRFIKKAPDESRREYIVFSLLAVILPYSFTWFSVWLGMLDIFWYIFTVIAIVCTRFKYLRWLAPLLAIACLATHYSAIFVFVPLLAIVLLYQAVKAEKKLAPSAVFAITVVLSLAATVYFVFFSDKTLTMTEDEMNTYLRQKMDIDVSYLGFYLFGENNHNLQGNLGFVVSTILSESQKSFDLYSTTHFLVSLIPLFAVIITILAKAVKHSNSAAERYVFGFGILLTAMLIPLRILSTDTERWAAMVIISQLTLIVCFLHDRNEAVCRSFSEVFAFFKARPVLCAAWLFMSFISVSAAIV